LSYYVIKVRAYHLLQEIYLNLVITILPSAVETRPFKKKKSETVMVFPMVFCSTLEDIKPKTKYDRAYQLISNLVSHTSGIHNLLVMECKLG